MPLNWLVRLLPVLLVLVVACAGDGQKHDDQQQSADTEQAEKRPGADQVDTGSADESKRSGSSEKASADQPKSGNSITAGDTATTDSRANLSKRSQQPDANSESDSGGSPSDSLNFILRGTVEGGARTEVILDKLGIAGDSEALASTIVNEEDRLQFGGKIARPGLYSLRFPSDQIIVVLEEGVQEIRTDFADLNEYEAKGDGAKGTRFMKRSFLLLNKYNNKGDSLRKVAKTTSNTDKKLRLYDILEKRQKNWNQDKFQEMKALIQEAWDANSVAAPAIAVRAQVQRDISFFENMHEDFKQQYPDNYFVQKFGDKLENARSYLEKQQ
jgi:hypothetical protein